MKMRYREKVVSDGDVIEVGDDPMALSIHTDPKGNRMSFVSWLEQDSFETLDDYKERIKKLEEGGLGK